MGFFEYLFGESSNSGKANCNNSGSAKSSLEGLMNVNEEISEDLIAEIQNNGIIYCSKSGVQFQDIPSMIKIMYDGVLAKDGAKDVYAVVGYGCNESWEDVEHYPMKKTAPQTFELVALRKRPGNVYMAFKDGADNWDNNSGSNYIFYDNNSEGSH